MADARYNIIIVGGGIVGLAVALEITRQFPRFACCCWKKKSAWDGIKAAITAA